MAKSGTASMTIAELREFASFTEDEQLFIERGLDVGLGRGDAFKEWSRKAGDKAAIRQQYLAYRELRALKDAVPCETSLDGIQDFMGALLRITAQDLAQELSPTLCRTLTKLRDSALRPIGGLSWPKLEPQR